MIKILILYYSKTDSVKNMAHQMALGVQKVGAQPILRTVPELSVTCEKTSENIPKSGDIYATKNDLKECKGLILGSPTYFGNMASSLKYFLDSTSDLWFKGALVNKPAGVFTSTASIHGGHESTLLSMMIPLLHHGVLFLGLPYTDPNLLKSITGGSPYGATHYAVNGSNLYDEEEKICQAQGHRIATLALKLDTESKFNNKK